MKYKIERNVNNFHTLSRKIPNQLYWELYGRLANQMSDHLEYSCYRYIAMHLHMQLKVGMTQMGRHICLQNTYKWIIK